MPANRDETGKFVKGKSGNPSGRPKVPEQFKELVQEKSIPALRAIIAIMENPESKANDVYMCAKLILEYANGKPVDKIDMTQRTEGDFVIKIGKGDEADDMD